MNAEKRVRDTLNLVGAKESCEGVNECTCVGPQQHACN